VTVFVDLEVVDARAEDGLDAAFAHRVVHDLRAFLGERVAPPGVAAHQVLRLDVLRAADGRKVDA